MVRNRLNVLLCCLLAASCGSAPPEAEPDATIPTDTQAPVVDLQVEPDIATCGEGIYPCGPYGTITGDTLENLRFLGYVDRDGDRVLDTTSSESADWGLSELKEYHLGTDKKLLWVVVSAVWCSVCKTENQELAQIYKQGKLDSRVELYQIMFEDEDYAPMSRQKLEEWIEAFGNPSFPYYAGTPLTFPNVMDPSYKMGKYFDKAATPFNMLVDLRTMKILYGKTGYSAQAIATAIQQALASL